jgi:hypothetical protein
MGTADPGRAENSDRKVTIARVRCGARARSTDRATLQAVGGGSHRSGSTHDACRTLAACQSVSDARQKA